MRVCADDEVGAAVGKKLRKLALSRAWRKLVFNAPMEEHDYEIGTEIVSLVDVGFHAVAIDSINNYPQTTATAVGAVGGANECDAGAFHIDDSRRKRVASGCVAIDAHRRDPERIEVEESASRTLIPLVEDVVVGGEEKVEARVAQLSRKSHRSGKRGVSAIWHTERTFKIDNRKIGFLYLLFHSLEAGSVVKRAIGTTRIFHLRSMLHRIAGKQQVDVAVFCEQ